MAANVTRSWSQIPQFVQQFKVDMSAVGAFRARRSEAGEPVGVTDILVAAIAHAASDVPEVNSTFTDAAVRLYQDVNVAIAVNTDRGLLVPVLARTQECTVAQISVLVRETVDRSRSGKTTADDAIATITLSNLGQLGVETGIPLITAPQAAIVFTGATIDTPVVQDGAVVIRPLMGFAIAYDHRIIDGVTGAAFDNALRRYLAQPELLNVAAVAAGGAS
jgi:pyruvate dehydrogenase E2 component (dihydrolipoamide acetyltransferase)